MGSATVLTSKRTSKDLPPRKLSIPVFAVRFSLAVNSFVDVVGLCTLGAVVVVMVGFSESLGAAVYGVCVGLICFCLRFFFSSSTPPLALLFSHMDCYNKTSPHPQTHFAPPSSSSPRACAGVSRLGSRRSLQVSLQTPLTQ